MDETQLASITAIVTALALFINIAVLAFLIRQVRIMQADVRSQGHIEMIARWNAVSEHEIRSPELHKLLMNDEALAATTEYTDDDMRQRAFLHMVMDVLSQRQAVLEELGEGEHDHEYLLNLMKNPRVRKLWDEGKLASAFDGDPFQRKANEAFKRAAE